MLVKPNLKKSILNTEELERYGNLMIFAKAQVDGYLAGKHRAPHFGYSSEFKEYHLYNPGEDSAQIDWNLWSRSHRLYRRTYEAETDMSMYLFVDTSNSMGFGDPQKFIHAAKLAAALAYLIIKQGDKASLTLFDSKIKTHLPPKGTQSHLQEIVATLESVKTRRTTSLSRALHQGSTLIKKRGKIVILSDFMDDIDSTFDALNMYIHRGCDVLLIPIHHLDEENLPMVDTARFVDLETNEEMRLDVPEIRKEYKKSFQEKFNNLETVANARGMGFAKVLTNEPYQKVLEHYLGFRDESIKV